MKEFTEKQKMFMKSNGICTICGKVVEAKDEYECSKTRRQNYVVVHKYCYKFRI